MIHSVCGVLIASAIGFQYRPADPPVDQLAALRATQLACSYRIDRGEVRFRASIVAKKADALVILTAAHCLGPDDAGRPIRLSRGDTAIEVEVLAAGRNPGFGRFEGGFPGADNAVALLRLDPEDADQVAFREGSGVAELADRMAARPEGRTLTVVTIDQFDKVHAVRGGNYDNPRWLQWGDSYRPIPGDSGSGVFAYRKAADPESPPQPVLVGVVTDRDPSGGGASLVARDLKWLARALRHAGAFPEDPAVSDAPPTS